MTPLEWALAALALGAVGLALLLLRDPARAIAAPAVSRSTLHVASGVGGSGPIRLRGDVVVASPDAPARRTELDVPTQDVDALLRALQSAGLDADDTGITVDTDEGEETLTTVAVDLARRPRDGAGPLRVRGDVHVRAGGHVACPLRATGRITLEDGARVDGDVRGRRGIVVGRSCRIRGDLVSRGDIHVGAGSTAAAVRCRELWMPPRGGPVLERVRAARVHTKPGDDA